MVLNQCCAGGDGGNGGDDGGGGDGGDGNVDGDGDADADSDAVKSRSSKVMDAAIVVKLCKKYQFGSLNAPLTTVQHETLLSYVTGLWHAAGYVCVCSNIATETVTLTRCDVCTVAGPVSNSLHVLC